MWPFGEWTWRADVWFIWNRVRSIAVGWHILIGSTSISILFFVVLIEFTFNKECRAYRARKSTVPLARSLGDSIDDCQCKWSENGWSIRFPLKLKTTTKKPVKELNCWNRSWNGKCVCWFSEIERMSVSIKHLKRILDFQCTASAFRRQYKHFRHLRSYFERVSQVFAYNWCCYFSVRRSLSLSLSVLFSLAALHPVCRH